MSGAQNLKHAVIRADQTELVLNRGGLSLKGVTFCGKDPPATFTNDKASINVAGMRWFLRQDLVSLGISDNILPRNAGERSHHSNRTSFQQTLQEGTVFQKCLRYMT